MKVKRALLIGIDEYDSRGTLVGCVNDVNALLPLLARNEDASSNFNCIPLTSAAMSVGRKRMLAALDHLFSPGADISLFYFAGHGVADDADVVLVSQDGSDEDPGIPMSAILGKIKQSTVGEIIVILDCCYAGGAGGVPQFGGNTAIMRHGTSILAATRSDQTAKETEDGRGLFSTYLCGALEGGAADVEGTVSLAGIYAYLSQSFGPWDQRPMFKANVDRLHELRRCAPAVPLGELRRLPEFFPDPNTVFPLDPSYEPDAEPKHEEHEAVFGILQRCRAAKLIDPVGADHMYFAAMQSGGCRLTPLGKHYWTMAKKNLL
jgi:hypothetical protein